MLERGIHKCIRECSVGGIICCRGLISLGASEEIDAISGPWLPACYTPLLCLSPTWLESWSKTLVEKNRKGAIFLRPALATRLASVENCFVELEVCLTRPLLPGDLKKVEFTATTNGLNSQLSLDKLKTNSWSLSKQMGRVVSSFSPWTLADIQSTLVFNNTTE